MMNEATSKQTNSATKRLHLELSPANASMFDALMRDLGFSKNIELINFALSIATWCVTERKGGKKICSMARNGTDVTELFFPMMLSALATASTIRATTTAATANSMVGREENAHDLQSASHGQRVSLI
jgi:hypothetical protein